MPGVLRIALGAVALAGSVWAAATKQLSLDPDALGLAPHQAERLREAVREGLWPAAETLLLEAARDRSRDAGIERALGIAHFQAGRHFAAAAALKRSDAVAPLDPDARFLLASAFLRLERPHWARAELDRLVRERPAAALYRYTLARVHYDQQRFGAAVKQLRQALDAEPRSVPARDLLGQCLEGLGAAEQALDAYREAIALGEAGEPDTAWPWFHLGSLLHDLGDLEAAREALRKALESDPGHFASAFELGLVLGKSGRHRDAVRLLKRAADLEPADARVHYFLSRAYRRLGDLERADAALRRYSLEQSSHRAAQLGP